MLVVHQMPVKKWVNEMGVPWPYADEFKVGCTVEHAGYVLSWLCAIFGPAEVVSSFSTTLVSDKVKDDPIESAHDWSVGCIRFKSGVVLRLTRGIYAPHDHRLRIFGDDGVIEVRDPRSDDSPVSVRRFIAFRRGRKLAPWSKRLPLLGSKVRHAKHKGKQRRDFLRVVADMAEAVREDRQPYLSADYCLHVNEIVLALHNSSDSQCPLRLSSTFERPEPLCWAT